MTTTPPKDLRLAPGRSTTKTARAVSVVLAALDRLAAPRPAAAPLEPGILRRVLAVWALGRVFSLGLLGFFYVLSRIEQWGFGPDGIPVSNFLSFLAGWDADRYGTIAQVGYPQWIPVEVGGDVVPNNWAFLPVFPFLMRVFTDATGLPWELVGVLISVAASAGATLALFLLLWRVGTPRSAWWGMVFFTFGPLSFVFVLAYAESLYLFLLFTALLCAVNRRYAWIAPLGVLLAFTRPGAVALALGLGILFLLRWWRRRDDPFPPRELAGLFAAGVITAGAGLLWPVIADRVTGFEHAYLRTEMAWWIPFVGRGDFLPMSPWFRFFSTYAGFIGIVFVLAVMIAFTLWVSSRSVRKLGVEVVAYTASYGLYLFAVFLPQQSIFRLIMPLSPLLADERLSSTPRRRRGILIACLVLQPLAVLLMWTVNHP